MTGFVFGLFSGVILAVANPKVYAWGTKKWAQIKAAVFKSDLT